MSFHLSRLARGHCAIVWASGQCSSDNAARLRDRLVELLAANSARLVVDLSALALLDGAGMDALAAVGEHAKRLGGSMVIVSGPMVELPR